MLFYYSENIYSYNLELNVIKSIQNRTRYYKLIIEESNNGKHLIGYYCKLLKYRWSSKHS